MDTNIIQNNNENEFKQFEDMLKYMRVPNTYWKKSAEYRYWFRSLLQKVSSSIDITGTPEEWPTNFLELSLFARGYVAVFRTERFGIAFQPCTISGYDFYWQPLKAVVANPYYQKELTIGKNCELLKLTPDYRGIFDIIDHYATQLAEISKGIMTGLINAKVPMILSANNESQSETLKKVYDKVQAGESLVIWQNIEGTDEIIPRKDPFESWNQDFKQTYIVHNLLEDCQMIMNNFFREVGLPVVQEKKERLITDEADMQGEQSMARITNWIECLEESIEKINKMFNLNLGVEYNARSNYDTGDTGVSRDEKQKSK